MPNLPNTHLATLTLDVDFPGVQVIGQTPAGMRSIAPVSGGSFSGARLNGTVLPGGKDWVITRADGCLLINVRLVLETDDKALIYLTYEGRFLASPDAIARFRTGETLSPDEYSLQAFARFESGDDRYAWLNDMLAIAVGTQTPPGPVYEIYGIG